jgi:uncharacterized membrane protein YfcA
MVEWILLIVISWIAATISGVAGFGGSLLILPVFSHIVGAKKAIPILTIAWMMGNLSRAAFGYRDIHWKPVRYFSLGAVPAAIIGSRLFVELPTELIMKGIGIFLLLVVLIRQTKWNRAIPQNWLIPVGAVVGFLSAVIGSAGPIGATAFLSLNLAPTAYVASEAVTAVLMHLTKSAIYGQYDLITTQDVGVGMILGLAMVVGSWTARRFLKQLSTRWFGRVVEGLLVVAAISLMV